MWGASLEQSCACSRVMPKVFCTLACRVCKKLVPSSHIVKYLCSLSLPRAPPRPRGARGRMYGVRPHAAARAHRSPGVHGSRRARVRGPGPAPRAPDPRPGPADALCTRS